MVKYHYLFRYLMDTFWILTVIFGMTAVGISAYFSPLFRLLFGVFLVVSVIFITTYKILTKHTNKVYASGSPRDYFWRLKDWVFCYHHPKLTEGKYSGNLLDFAYSLPIIQGGESEDAKAFNSFLKDYNNTDDSQKRYDILKRTHSYVLTRIAELKPKAKHCNQKKYTALMEAHQ